MASEDATVSRTVVETRSQGRAVLDMGPDRVGVSSNAQLLINRSDRKATRLELKRGTVAARVDPARGKRDFSIHTPLGEIHVVGTEFRVNVEAQVLTVEVRHGVVEIEPVKGERVQVGAGNRVRVMAGTATLDHVVATRFVELERELQPSAVPATPDAGAVAAEQNVDAGRPQTRAPRAQAPIAEWRQRAARGDCLQVVKEAKRHLIRQPHEAAAWLVIGDCQRRSKRFPEAIGSYLEAGKQQGTEGHTGMLLAASVMQDQLKQHSRALKVLEALVARHPPESVEAAALVRQALALKSMGRARQARAILERVVTQFADTPSAPEAARLLNAK